MMDNDDLNMADMCRVLQSVEELQGRIRGGDPNYYNVYRNPCVWPYMKIETTIRYLRLADKIGFIEGYGGFYNRAGGGSKKWRFIRYPTSIEIIRGDLYDDVLQSRLRV